MKFDLTLRWLSLVILAFQIYIPWSVGHFVTQDGPAHIYTAFVTKDLIFHRHTSPYHEIYRVQKIALPNWTCTVLLAGILAAFGPDHAEALLTTVCLLVAYMSFAFFVGWGRGPPLLIANWLMQSWFLWAGFYNFYLGMALLPLVLAVYLRRRSLLLSSLLILLFFTHLVPAALAVMTIVILGIWRKQGWKFALPLVPTIALIAWYALRFKRDTRYSPDILLALRSFPHKIFVFTSGWAGEQRYLWILLLLLILSVIFLMRRQEWKGLPGGLAITTIVMAVLYFLVPDVGFGGSVVKMRFCFAVFLFGALLICSVSRLHAFLPYLGLLLSVVLVAQLIPMARQVQTTSHAVESYLTATDRLPIGARFVRMYFPAPYHHHAFGADSLSYLPLLHVDELGAVRRHAVDLSDYQSATGTFSIALKPSIDDGHAQSLNFETPGSDAWASVAWLNGGLPAPIDYVVYFGDEGPARDAPVKYVGGTSAVRIYRLNAASL